MMWSYSPLLLAFLVVESSAKDALFVKSRSEAAGGDSSAPRASPQGAIPVVSWHNEDERRRLQTPGLGPPCNLCGDGTGLVVGNPTATILFSGSSEPAPCGIVEELLLEGILPPGLCAAVAPATDVTPCACGPSLAPVAPVTPAPVTNAPVTLAPVSPAPVSPAPVTAAPVAPVSPAPVTSAPVTPAPVTPAPVTPTGAPITPAPVTPAPVTPAPVTPAPVTPAPVTAAPISLGDDDDDSSDKKGKKTKEPTPAPVPVIPTTPLPTPSPTKRPTNLPTVEPTSGLQQKIEDVTPFVGLIINLACLAFGICPVPVETLYPPGTSPP